jgi:calcineurin-like phosphoesterase family protein
MARYVVSDHHFGHVNIIKYTDRPFSSVGDMNSTMLDRHYAVVSNDDVLVHLGDVAMDMQDGRETIEYFQRLGGDVLVRGNHDVGLSLGEAPFPVLESCVLEHDGFEFYCTHRPESVPDEWDGWVIHGHEHNNHPDRYPFVAADKRRVNVSVELLGYRPLALDSLTDLLEECPQGSRIRDLDVAVSQFEWSPETTLQE